MFILRYMLWLGGRTRIFFTVFFFLVISGQSSYSSCRPNSETDVQDSVGWTLYVFLITHQRPEADMKNTLIIYPGQNQASFQLENLSLAGIFLHVCLLLSFLFTLSSLSLSRDESYPSMNNITLSLHFTDNSGQIQR